MSPPELTEPEEVASAGTPMWMLTFGDTTTLLVTFFVMMLTFSGPSDEDYLQFTRGILAGSRSIGIRGWTQSGPNLARDAQRLAASRVADEGAEKPPQTADVPLDELTQQYAEVDVSKLQDLKGTILIRMPLVELFGPGLALTDSGRRVLDEVAKVARGGSYSIVVRAEAGGNLSRADRARRSALFASQVVGYLQASAGEAAKDVGLSDNVELGPSPVLEGQCEVVMLEV